tara:strand:- start:853 stop:1464 length:612 start_codon:yes stop_codon:yes gene_type:complete
MFAIVESGSITSMPRGNKGVEINGVKHPASIFTLWSESERNAIGVYTIQIDNTNLKDEQWYINTGMSYAYDSSANKVKGTYGTATARAHADTLWTEKDKTDGLIPSDKDVGDVASEGLKTILIRQVKRDSETILNETDWYITRKSEKSTAIPSSITTHRDAVRTKQAEMETAITNAADTAALETLYSRNDSGVRPLGDLPRLT